MDGGTVQRRILTFSLRRDADEGSLAEELEAESDYEAERDD